jgi:hypothetical protein
MSILQEYEMIRKELGEARYQRIEDFLSIHPELELSDVYYKPKVFAEFEKYEDSVNQPKETRKPREKESEEMER